MKPGLEQLIGATVRNLFGVDIPVKLVRIDDKLGDFATNVAFKLSSELKKSPEEIADTLSQSINRDGQKHGIKASVAGRGFVNLVLDDKVLIDSIGQSPDKTFAGRVVVVEYSDPNPFKILHAGHLYTSIIGDSIANLLESAGAKVYRVNFGGDIGLHVAKNIWSIINRLGGENPSKLSEIEESKRSAWLSSNYIEGNHAYETDETVKQDIIALNKKLYNLVDLGDHDSPLAQIYWTCRQWSYQSFDEFYGRIGSHFDKYYPESQTAPVGIKTVREQLKKGVYKLSEGAVVFEGEKYGLHTRVFINSQGLPTYETKDVGLIMSKWDDYHFDKSVVITGNEIFEYMRVVLKSVEQFEPELVAATTHLTHGMVKLKGGVKMSSRKGNFITASDVLDEAAKAGKALSGSTDEQVTLGAVKYSFLKQRIGGDVIYDPLESVSLEGNSGPYLQYAYARARSILAKSLATTQTVSDLQEGERRLAQKISEYAEVVNAATSELMPHHLCSYLYELTQVFNVFYENNRVLSDPRQAQRLWLLDKYADVLKRGLKTLGIATLEKM